MTYLEMMSRKNRGVGRSHEGRFDFMSIEKAHKKNKRRRWVNKGRTGG